MFTQHVITNVYVLPFFSKSNLARFPLIQSGLRALQKTKFWPLVSSLFCPECNRKGGKCKITNVITNVYILPLFSKSNLARFPLIQSGFKALQKTKFWPLVSSLFCPERNRKGGKCKISRVLQLPVF